MRTRQCPECGRHNLPEIAVCNCGRNVWAGKPKRFSILWATVPLIIPLALMLRVQSSSVFTSSAFDARLRPRTCVETIGVKLNDRQILSGTARNTCVDPVRKVRLSIFIADEKGSRRAQPIEIKELEPGETQRFERALTGRVKSWEIASDK